MSTHTNVNPTGVLMIRMAQQRAAERALAKERHQAWLDALKRDFQSGAIIVDPDDPRTTVALTEAEVAYVRGEAHDLCGKRDCDCDEQYQALVDQREDGDEVEDEL